ncbi:nucleotide-binding universal stress UspA family protein [Streptacidiphilus sp. MAP12-33]|uniref:universal stress protein n=1 Tax=Streptacidiphilus sp. MAP12-33 TaxID=3156266 RepID=UPI003516DAD8
MTARPVLAAIDGSPTSLAAARWAAAEAQCRGAALRLVHVWPRTVGIYLEQLRDEGDALLSRAQEEISGRYPELEVDTVLLGASPVDGLLEAAREGQLLVLGTRGLGGFTGLLVGSVSLAVAGRSPIPVVVVRPDVDGDSAEGTSRAGDVVVGVGPGEAADELLEFAFTRAQDRGARLVAVHGWNLPALWATPGTIVPPIDSETLENAARAHLVQTLRPWQDKYPQVSVVVRLDGAGPAKAVVDASERAEMLVIGRRARKHAPGGHLGFTAHAALHHAHAPVVVVPHP